MNDNWLGPQSIYSNPVISREIERARDEAIRVAKENGKIREATINSYASTTAQYIYNSILDFSNKIGDDYEVGMHLTSLGQSVQVYLNDLAYYEPHLIIFDSEFKDGSKMRIVQHVTQLNYALIALPKKEHDKPKRQIGFRQQNE